MKPKDPTECPQCGHLNVYTMTYLAETRVDPEAWMGRCECNDTGQSPDGDTCTCNWMSQV